MMSYRIERISENNLDDFLALYAIVHRVKPDKAKYKNKFNTTHTGIAYIGFLAYSNENEVSAFYGVFPTIFFLNGEKVLAAQSGYNDTSKTQKKRTF